MAAALLAAAAPAHAAAQQAAAALAPPDTTLGLADAVAAALQVSTLTARSDAAVRTARSAERVTLGAYLPSLALQPGVSRTAALTTTPGAEGSETSYSATLQAGYDVFTAGRRGADRRRAQADVAAAQAGDVSDRYAVVGQVKRTFYDVQRAEDLYQAAGTALVRAERDSVSVFRRHQVGTATRSDGLRVRLEVTTARRALLTAETNRRTAMYALGRLVGRAGAVGARREGSLDPRPLALDDSSVVSLAVGASPDVRAAQAGESAAAAALRSSRTQYLPTLRLTGGYTWVNQNLVPGAPRPGWSLGLGASYPIFNGFQREDAVTRADAQATVARVAAADARLQARAEAERLLGELRLTQEQISLAADAVEAANEDVRTQRERYEVGASTLLDVTTAEAAVADAEQALVNARYDYQLARASLETLLGREL